MKTTTAIGLTLALFLGSCAAQAPSTETTEETAEVVPSAGNGLTESVEVEASSSGVVAAKATESNANQYNFSVTVQSPDTGCDAYANWWEVITPDGELLYRRILAHSHVDEQPFTRSGGPVEVGATDEVIVRSHMHPTGYIPQAMKGTPTTGFTSTILPEDFAQALAEAEPQPGGCAF